MQSNGLLVTYYNDFPYQINICKPSSQCSLQVEKDLKVQWESHCEVSQHEAREKNRNILQITIIDPVMRKQKSKRKESQHTVKFIKSFYFQDKSFPISQLKGSLYCHLVSCLCNPKPGSLVHIALPLLCSWEKSMCGFMHP